MTDDDLIALDQQLCFMFYVASRAMTRAYQPLLNELGITYPQYLVMMVLWEWDQKHQSDELEVEPTLKTLGQRLYLDSGTLTPLIKRLQTQGLVDRNRDRNDERKVLLSLTQDGRELRNKALAWLVPKSEVLQGKSEEIIKLREDIRQFMKQVNLV